MPLIVQDARECLAVLSPHVSADSDTESNE
jgi:hypothetical protein